jgi:hypothetical protein
MYMRSGNIAGATFMRCKDCGNTISVNKICEKPIQAVTDMLKHMAAHKASPVFVAVERDIRHGGNGHPPSGRPC